MLELFWWFFSIPLGFFFAYLTRDEREIYSKAPYFPIILWVLIISLAVFFTIDKTIAKVLTFVFITILIWNKAKF